MLLDGIWIENLVRFPVEQRIRPSFKMMADLAPDCRMIPAVAEALEIDDIDPDLKHVVDRETAAYLAGLELPENPAARRKVFNDMREQALAPAIAASIEAKRLADDAYRASRVAIDAGEEKSLNAFALGRRANHCLNASARAALEAHRLCEIARGKCRAIGLAEAGEAWTPFNAHEETAWLIKAHTDAAARRVGGTG